MNGRPAPSGADRTRLTGRLTAFPEPRNFGLAFFPMVLNIVARIKDCGRRLMFNRSYCARFFVFFAFWFAMIYAILGTKQYVLFAVAILAAALSIFLIYRDPRYLFARLMFLCFSALISIPLGRSFALSATAKTGDETSMQACPAEDALCQVDRMVSHSIDVSIAFGESNAGWLVLVFVILLLCHIGLNHGVAILDSLGILVSKTSKIHVAHIETDSTFGKDLGAAPTKILTPYRALMFLQVTNDSDADLRIASIVFIESIFCCELIRRPSTIHIDRTGGGTQMALTMSDAIKPGETVSIVSDFRFKKLGFMNKYFGLDGTLLMKTNCGKKFENEPIHIRKA